MCTEFYVSCSVMADVPCQNNSSIIETKEIFDSFVFYFGRPVLDRSDVDEFKQRVYCECKTRHPNMSLSYNSFKLYGFSPIGD